jgi:hypothetical protein
VPISQMVSPTPAPNRIRRNTACTSCRDSKVRVATGNQSPNGPEADQLVYYGPMGCCATAYVWADIVYRLSAMLVLHQLSHVCGAQSLASLVSLINRINESPEEGLCLKFIKFKCSIHCD